MLGISGADEQGRGLQEHHQPTVRVERRHPAEDGGWSGQAGGGEDKRSRFGRETLMSLLDASRKGGMCDRKRRGGGFRGVGRVECRRQERTGANASAVSEWRRVALNPTVHSTSFVKPCQTLSSFLSDAFSAHPFGPRLSHD